MPKKNSANPFKYHIWFALLIFLVGLVFGYLLQIPKYNPESSISLQIDPTNILSVLATIVIAFYLANIIERKKESVKAEKELILSKVEDYEVIFSQYLLAIRKNGIEVSTVNSYFKNLRTTLKDIGDYIKLSDLDVEANIMEDLGKSLKMLLDLCTDTKRFKGDIIQYSREIPFVVKENIYTYSKERLDHIMEQENKIVKLLFQFQISIMRN